MGLRYSIYKVLYRFSFPKSEFHIIGISPNNDSHLLRIINSNPNITNAVYFSASCEDTAAAQKVIKKPLQTQDVFKY